jgi:LacI family transcriptional regulator
MEDLSRFCCQNPVCELQGKRDAGNLYVRAHYGKQQRRLLCCRVCGQRFSERKGTPLFGSKLASEKSLSVLEHLHEGCGVRRAADGAADEGEPCDGGTAGTAGGWTRQNPAR